jgi:hypothetical protein
LQIRLRHNGFHEPHHSLDISRLSRITLAFGRIIRASASRNIAAVIVTNPAAHDHSGNRAKQRTTGLENGRLRTSFNWGLLLSRWFSCISVFVSILVVNHAIQGSIPHRLFRARAGKFVQEGQDRARRRQAGIRAQIVQSGQVPDPAARCVVEVRPERGHARHVLDRHVATAVIGLTRNVARSLLFLLRRQQQTHHRLQTGAARS